jgi:S-DNA-T family DNA segregation ATPase FtsK/SpoIIIE
MFRVRGSRKAGRKGRPPELSIWDPVHLGVDERGQPVLVGLSGRNLLAAGEPGAGKSVGLNLIVAHAALSADCRLILIDGKRVELGLWRACAESFIGPNIAEAIELLRRLQSTMDTRYDELLDTGRRKITRTSGLPVVLVVFDELAYFSATIGETKQQKEFVALVRDLVARGRAAGIIVVAATQRPSADIIPTSLRDLFGYRWAFRCTTDASSDVILGHGWANAGYTATDIDPSARGVGWLIADDGNPRRMKAAYLTDEQVAALAAHAVRLRAAQHRPAAVPELTDDGGAP